MPRSIFGWDLPPGCTHRHIEEAFGGNEVCEVCCNPVDDCICPECPVCGEQGNPQCYEPGHESDDVRLQGRLTYTNQQLINRAIAKIENLKEQIMWEERALEVLRSKVGE